MGTVILASFKRVNMDRTTCCRIRCSHQLSLDGRNSGEPKQPLSHSRYWYRPEVDYRIQQIAHDSRSKATVETVLFKPKTTQTMKPIFETKAVIWNFNAAILYTSVRHFVQWLTGIVIVRIPCRRPHYGLHPVCLSVCPSIPCLSLFQKRKICIIQTWWEGEGEAPSLSCNSNIGSEVKKSKVSFASCTILRETKMCNNFQVNQWLYELENWYSLRVDHLKRWKRWTFQSSRSKVRLCVCQRTYKLLENKVTRTVQTW